MPGSHASAHPEARPLSFRSQAAFERWLARNHDKVPAIWIRYAKKGAGVASVTYAEALDVALCYGWIDGQAKSLDERFYMQRWTPRARRSKWSKINCGKVEALVAAGRMTAAGLRQIEAAKADGRWAAAYASPRNATVPDDLRAALAKDRRAAALFETLSARNRFAILYQVHDAKRPETRAKRIAKFVAMLAKGETPYP